VRVLETHWSSGLFMCESHLQNALIGRRFTYKTVQALSYGLTIFPRAKSFENPSKGHSTSFLSLSSFLCFTWKFWKLVVSSPGPFFFFWYDVSQCKVQYFVLYQRLHSGTALQIFESKKKPIHLNTNTPWLHFSSPMPLWILQSLSWRSHALSQTPYRCHRDWVISGQHKSQ